MAGARELRIDSHQLSDTARTANSSTWWSTNGASAKNGWEKTYAKMNHHLDLLSKFLRILFKIHKIQALPPSYSRAPCIVQVDGPRKGWAQGTAVEARQGGHAGHVGHRWVGRLHGGRPQRRRGWEAHEDRWSGWEWHEAQMLTHVGPTRHRSKVLTAMRFWELWPRFQTDFRR